MNQKFAGPAAQRRVRPGLARERKARPSRRCKRHRLTMRWKVAAQAVESVRPLFAVAVFVRTDALEDVRASRLA